MRTGKRDAQGELKEVYEKLHIQRKGEGINQERATSGPPNTTACFAPSKSESYVEQGRVDMGIHASRIRVDHGAAGDDFYRTIRYPQLPILNGGPEYPKTSTYLKRAIERSPTSPRVLVYLPWLTWTGPTSDIG